MLLPTKLSSLCCYHLQYFVCYSYTIRIDWRPITISAKCCSDAMGTGMGDMDKSSGGGSARPPIGGIILYNECYGKKESSRGGSFLLLQRRKAGAGSHSFCHQEC